MPASWRVVSEIYEEGRDFPIVVHIFFGQSDQEAASYYRAHRDSDTFLAYCAGVSPHFKVAIKCRERHRLEHLVRGRWVPYVKQGDGWWS
jgi:hypothetical protein